MAKTNALNRNLQFHTQEIMPSRWLRPRSRIDFGSFARLILGALLGIIGALWFQWRRS